MGVEQNDFATLRQTLRTERVTSSSVGGDSARRHKQSSLASPCVGGEAVRVLLHPLPLFNNSIGAHDMGMMNGAMGVSEMLSAAGESVRAMYVAAAPQEQLEEHPDALGNLEFLVVQELFETATTAFADVVLPAASFAEVDGTFTNNDGFVQRVRQSIAPVHSAKPDWIISAQLANELGVDFGFQMSASSVFREIAEQIPAYAELRYPLLKDESKPVQVKLQSPIKGI